MAFACSHGKILKTYHSLQETTERHVSWGGRYESPNVGAWMNFPGKTLKKVHFTCTGIPDLQKLLGLLYIKREIMCFHAATLRHYRGLFFGDLTVACKWWVKAGKENKSSEFTVTRLCQTSNRRIDCFLAHRNSTEWTETFLWTMQEIFMVTPENMTKMTKIHKFVSISCNC